MPMKLLHRLSRETMPFEMTDPKDLYNLQILRAAGYISASIPLPYYAFDRKWHREPATIHQLTPLGYMVLRYLGSIHSNRIVAVNVDAMKKIARNDPLAFKALPRFANIS